MAHGARSSASSTRLALKDCRIIDSLEASCTGFGAQRAPSEKIAGAIFRQALSALAAAAALAIPACSAIVNPDETRIGGSRDGGGGVLDGGDCSCADDGIACTVDACGATGVCGHTPNDAACAPGERCSPTAGCIPNTCTGDAECNDGNVCNGTERCADGVCGPGAPTICDDGASCTVDTCDPVSGCIQTPRDAMCDDAVSCTRDACAPHRVPGSADGCEHIADDSMCDDGACFTGGVCNAAMGCVGGTMRDCSDGDFCTYDACDADSGECVYSPLDVDRDGYPAMISGGRRCEGGTDCDDRSEAINPGAMEVCGNGLDDDCDGVPDDGCTIDVPDTCATARRIALDGSGRGSASGNLAELRDDYRACGGDGGRDAIYYIELTGQSDVLIDTSGGMAAIDTVLAAGTCDAGGDFVSAVCNDDQDQESSGSSVVTSRVFVHRIGPTAGMSSIRLYIMVEGYSGSTTGTYQLNVQVRRAAADACSPEPLDITGGGSLLGFGTPSLAGFGASGSCMSSDPVFAGEAVLRFSPTSGRRGDRLEVTSSSFDPAVYLRTECGRSDSEVACETADAGGTASIDVGSLSPTRYFVFVDNMTGGGAGAVYSYTVRYDP